MRTTTMRITNTTINRNFTRSINDVHDRLIKSINKVGSGKAYEAAADNPLAYYEGKKIDGQYSDVMSKLSLVTDVKNRLYQQELGARSIQKTLSEAKTRVQYILSDSNNEKMSTGGTVKDDLLQKQQSMVNDLNAQYQNFYIYGGNDISTAPFSLSSDGKTLTFSHQFAGENTPTEMKMTLEKQADGSYQYEFDRDTLNNMLRAMKEQGRVDVGYGTISDKSTLLDTYTGGLNLLTGLNSDAVNTMSEADALKAIEDRMNKSPVGLLGRAAAALSDYEAGGDKGEFSSALGDIMDCMTATEHYVTTVYSDLGNKYSLLETTADKLTSMKQNLTEQYKDKLGADPYEAILDMYNQQYSYSCAQRVSSYLMQSSLFDFMR